VVLKCNKCRKEVEHEVRVYNKGRYQYQGNVCKKCGEWKDIRKKEKPEWFDKMNRKKIF